MPSKSQLASDAITVEQDMIGENVGCQDQAIAAFGGLRRIEFLRDGERHVAPVILSRSRLDELQQHLMLVYTGQSRNRLRHRLRAGAGPSATAAGELRTMTADGRRGDGDPDPRRRHLPLRPAAARELDAQALADLEGLDRRASTTSTRRRAAAGAIGGKLLGAGGGGFLLLFVRPEDRRRVCGSGSTGSSTSRSASPRPAARSSTTTGCQAGEESWIRELPEPAAFAS